MKALPLFAVSLAAAVLLSGCGQSKAATESAKPRFERIDYLARAIDPETGNVCYMTAGGSLSCVHGHEGAGK